MNDVYYQKPVSMMNKREKAALAQQQKSAQLEKERLLKMSDAERDIYYREKELAMQQQMIASQKIAIQNQNEQIRMQQKQMKAMAKCPRCGSTSLSGNNKGYGVVKGALGAAALGAATGGIGAIIGLGAGNIGRKKVYVTCMKCGKRFKA